MIKGKYTKVFLKNFNLWNGIALIISIATLIWSIKLNNENNELQINQFNLNNVPDFRIDSIFCSSKDTINRSNPKLFATFYMSNRSNHSLTNVYSFVQATITGDKSIRQEYLDSLAEGNINPSIGSRKAWNKVDELDNIFGSNMGYQTTLKFNDLTPKDSIVYIHYYIIFKSETNGYYDRYAIMKIERKEIKAISIKDLRNNKTTMYPNINYFKNSYPEFNEDEFNMYFSTNDTTAFLLQYTKKVTSVGHAFSTDEVNKYGIKKLDR